jgi:hypothetical protein
MPALKDIAGLIDHSLLRPDATYTKINFGSGSCKKGEEAFSERFYFVEKTECFKDKIPRRPELVRVENERRDCLLPLYADL